MKNFPFYIVIVVAFILIIFGSIYYSGNEVKFADYNNEYYVSLSGDDDNGGSLENPWRTINYGVSQMSSEGGDILYIREGTYHELVEDFVSGTEGNPNVVSGYPGENVVISAGEELIGWEEIAGSDIYRNYTTWTSEHTRPKKLFANDETMIWAQYPNEGEFLYPNEEKDGPITSISSDGFRDEDSDDYWIGSTVVFYGYDVAGWGFGVNRVITDYDKESKTIYFDQIDRDLETDIPFIIRGNVQEVDVPGEWAVDLNSQEGYVYFYPESPIEDQYVIVASRGMAIDLELKSNIEIRGISIYHQNYDAHSSHAAVTVEISENIVLDGLDVSLTTWTGIRINESINVVINDMISQNIGGSAILVSSSNDTVLSNSHISNTGDTYQRNSAVGYRYDCDGITITNNYIGDNHYNYQTGLGIFLGSKNAYIANNEFMNNHGDSVLLEDSRDDSPDHVVKNIIFENNVLYNAISSYAGSLWLDNAQNVIVRNNLIYGTKGSTANGIKISSSNLKPDPKPGASKNITVVNNIIFDNTYGMYVYANESINISHNTFVDSRLNGFATLRNAGDIIFKDNLIQSDHAIVRIAEDSIETHNQSDDFDNNYYAPSSNVTYPYDDSITVDRFIIGHYHYNYHYNFIEYQDAFPGQELNSVNGDEVIFVDEDGLDFRPIEGSIVCGAASDGSDIGALPCYSPSNENPSSGNPNSGSNVDDTEEDSDDYQTKTPSINAPIEAFYTAVYFVQSHTIAMVLVIAIIITALIGANRIYFRKKKRKNY